MEEDTLCPMCSWPYPYRDGDQMVCLECGNQWDPEPEQRLP